MRCTPLRAKHIKDNKYGYSGHIQFHELEILVKIKIKITYENILQLKYGIDDDLVLTTICYYKFMDLEVEAKNSKVFKYLKYFKISIYYNLLIIFPNIIRINSLY